MPHFIRNRRNPAAAAALFVLLAALLLSACGGSSKSSSSTASSSASASTTTNPAGGKGGAGRFTALRTCLQKNGITLPTRTPGQGAAPGTGGRFRPGSGGGLPKGVTQSQFQAALKKCGGTNFLRRGTGAGGPGATQRFAKFAACMAKNGIKLPAPNTSGKGPIFNTSGVDTSSAKFKAADQKCAGELRPAGAGAGAPGAAQGAPGAPQGAPSGQ